MYIKFYISLIAVNKLNSFSETGFQDYLTDTLNKGTLAIMLSIGHRTKLFDIISSLGNPSTNEEIALQLHQIHITLHFYAMDFYTCSSRRRYCKLL